MLRSAASSQRSNATAKEGHVNYDVFDALIEAHAAPTTGSGCFGWEMACAQRFTESLTASRTTFLVDLHTTRLARIALSH